MGVITRRRSNRIFGWSITYSGAGMFPNEVELFSAQWREKEVKDYKLACQNIFISVYYPQARFLYFHFFSLLHWINNDIRHGFADRWMRLLTSDGETAVKLSVFSIHRASCPVTALPPCEDTKWGVTNYYLFFFSLSLSSSAWSSSETRGKEDTNEDGGYWNV